MSCDSRHNAEKAGRQMEQAVTESPYRTYKEAAAYCRVHRTTLWRAVRDGRLKVVGPETTPRFHIRDLDQFMARARSDQD